MLAVFGRLVECVILLTVRELCNTLYNLHTHAPVVIWTFPEAGLVVLAVHGPVGAQTPEPFAAVLAR